MDFKDRKLEWEILFGFVAIIAVVIFIFDTNYGDKVISSVQVATTIVLTYMLVLIAHNGNLMNNNIRNENRLNKLKDKYYEELYINFKYKVFISELAAIHSKLDFNNRNDYLEKLKTMDALIEEYYDENEIVKYHKYSNNICDSIMKARPLKVCKRAIKGYSKKSDYLLFMDNFGSLLDDLKGWNAALRYFTDKYEKELTDNDLI